MGGDGSPRAVRPWAALRDGFLIQIANPKVVVFFGSIFFALLPAGSPPWVMAAAIAIVFANEVSWYAAVSLLFSARRPRDVYVRLKAPFDRAMAGVLALIGARLIADAR